MSHDSELNIRAELCQVITPDTGKNKSNHIFDCTAFNSFYWLMLAL
jgi:hypothetical protein